MRHTFGQDLASYTMALGTSEYPTTAGITGRNQVIVGGQVVTFWNAQVGGEQYTDLLTASIGGPDDPGGSTITYVTTSPGATTDPPLGSIPMFLGPDGVTTMWAQVGDSVPVPPVTADTGTGTGNTGPAAGTGGTGSAGTGDDSIGVDDGTIDLGDDFDIGTPTAGDGQVEATGGVASPPGASDPTVVNSAGVGDENVSVASIVSGRLLIIASTAGLQLGKQLQKLQDDTTGRLDGLETTVAEHGAHLITHDQQIAALQSKTGGSTDGGGTGGGGGGGMVVGTTAQRPAASNGAMYLDYQTSRIWIGVPKADGSGSVWAPPPGTQVFTARSTKQRTIKDQGTLSVPMDEVDLDLIQAFSGAKPTRFTPTVPGYYQLNGGVGFGANHNARANGVRYIRWMINNAGPAGAVTAYTASDAYTVVVPARTYSVYLNGSGDYVEMVAYHNAGIDMTTAETSWGQSSMSIVYQGGSSR